MPPQPGGVIFEAGGDISNWPKIAPRSSGWRDGYDCTFGSASGEISRLRAREKSGKVQNLFPRAVRLYLTRLDELWASLFPASLPLAPGLTADSSFYGREFATRFFQLHLTATPCVSPRLPSSAPVGSFHPTRFCPCWTHWGRHFCLPSPQAGFFRTFERLEKLSDIGHPDLSFCKSECYRSHLPYPNFGIQVKM